MTSPHTPRPTIREFRRWAAANPAEVSKALGGVKLADCTIRRETRSERFQRTLATYLWEQYMMWRFDHPTAPPKEFLAYVRERLAADAPPEPAP